MVNEVIDVLTKVAIWIFFVLSIVWFIKKTNREPNKYWKLITIFLLFGIMIFIVLFILDSKNVFVNGQFDKYVPKERWTKFIFDSASAALGGIVSGIILISITAIQVKSQQESNMEDRRISNLPVLNYEFESLVNVRHTAGIVKIEGPSSSKFLCLKVTIENRGMNFIRKGLINVKTELSNDDTYYDIEELRLLGKDKNANRIFEIPILDEITHIEFSVKYQDALFNWYEQKVIYVVDNTKWTHDFSGGKNIKVVSKTICDEKIIK